MREGSELLLQKRSAFVLARFVGAKDFDTKLRRRAANREDCSIRTSKQSVIKHCAVSRHDGEIIAPRWISNQAMVDIWLTRGDSVYEFDCRFESLDIRGTVLDADD